MPPTTLWESPPEEPTQRRAILRRARYGYLLAFHRLLLGAAGRNLTEVAAFLCCSRSSVYRIVQGYRTGSLSLSNPIEGAFGDVHDKCTQPHTETSPLHCKLV